jgi:hypothetical protein
MIAYQLREVWIGNGFVFFFVIDIDVIETKEVQEIGVIDDAQAEELTNTRFRSSVFQWGQPSVRNTKPLIFLGVGDATACLFDVPNRDVAIIAKRFELLTRGHSRPRC